MYLGIVSPQATVSFVLGSGALTAYASDLFARGGVIAERLVQGGFSPADIAFDADGVVQFYAVGNQQGELDFYRTFYEGGVATGSATQYLMKGPLCPVP